MIGPVMLDLQGVALTQDERRLLVQPAVGGVIFFARNFTDRDQLRALVTEVRAVNPSLLLAVDQEGGRVQRFRQGYTRLPPLGFFADLYRHQPQQALERAEDCGWLMAVEILASGVDFSFAPVLDLDRQLCSAIGDRAFSGSVDTVVRLGEAYIRGMHSAGMAATGKHFPGHGSVAGDTHVTSPVDHRSFADIQREDMQTFVRLLPRLAAVMPAHVVFDGVDNQPVGFSRRWLQDILRQQLGFQGVVFSDDLTMEAATAGGSFAERALAALEAGCDMVLVCNNRRGAEEAVTSLGNRQASARLSAMRARAEWSWAQLQALPRWQALNHYFSALNDARP